MASRRITARRALWVALRVAAGAVLLAITLIATAQSPTAGAIGLVAAALIYSGLTRTLGHGLPQSNRAAQVPADGPGAPTDSGRRRRWDRQVVVVALAAVIAALSVSFFALQVNHSDFDDSEEFFPERAVVAATYHGTADYRDDCNCWAMVDSLAMSAGTFDETAANVRLAAVTSDELLDAIVAAVIRDGWEPTLLGGDLELTRERQVDAPSDGTGPPRLLAAHRLPISVPATLVDDLRVLVRLDPDSLLRLTAPDKAVSATDPAFGGRSLLAQGREQVDVPVADALPRTASSGSPFAHVVIDVLNPWARIGAVGPALARIQTGGLAAIVLVGLLGLVGVIGRPQMVPMVRSTIGKLRSWLAGRREARHTGSESDDRGYL